MGTSAETVGDSVQTVDEQAIQVQSAHKADAGLPQQKRVAMVPREQLMRSISAMGRDAGIVLVQAPAGFGKTSLLLLYSAWVKEDPQRGQAWLIDASRREIKGVIEFLDDAAHESIAAVRPLLGLDNVSVKNKDEAQELASAVRACREAGCEIVLVCEPGQAELVTALGDSAKVGARQLCVQPQEYATWIKTLMIDSTLDAYRLTAGIPSLVSALQTIAGEKRSSELLEREVERVVGSVLKALSGRRDSLYQTICLLLLLGSGSLREIRRGGCRVQSRQMQRLMHDYPIVVYAPDTEEFSCLGERDAALGRLRAAIARRHPEYVERAVRILLRVDRVDDAVRLMESFMDVARRVEAIASRPMAFAFAGQASFVRSAMVEAGEEACCRAGLGLVLASWACALITGEYRTARNAADRLAREAMRISREVDADEWDRALAFNEYWGGGAGTALPVLSKEMQKRATYGAAVQLRRARHITRSLIERGRVPVGEHREHEATCPNALDVPSMLLEMAFDLGQIMCDGPSVQGEVDARLQDEIARASEKRLEAVVNRLRAVAAMGRLMAGRPVVDERAFVDAERTSLRESDHTAQLFCTVAQGWMDFSMGQQLNASFRAQQAGKTAPDDLTFVRAWAKLLECATRLRSTSRMIISQEADLLDLSVETDDAADAWATTLLLSAAHHDAELSAWFSMHRDILLAEWLRPQVRLAMFHLGEMSAAVRRLVPPSMVVKFQLGDAAVRNAELEVLDAVLEPQIGQISIRLFGGLRVERNGHVLTGHDWKRKRASVLAARLALVLGSYIGRGQLIDEMWPNSTYKRARQNLYGAITALIQALGQQQDGVQYVIKQGKSIGLNAEFVTTDLMQFDILARQVLLKRTGMTNRQLIDACLKMEQIYTGALYVPDSGDVTCFVRLRRSYQSKFIDCMVRGIDLSIEENDLPSATWLVEAALKHEPTREDVVRHAMTVYNLNGRKREVVELYGSHLYYLHHELHMEPEDETRLLYENIMGEKRVNELL